MEIESGIGRFMIDLDRFRTALGAADPVYGAMESGLVQPAMMAAMTIEARHFSANEEAWFASFPS